MTSIIELADRTIERIQRLVDARTNAKQSQAFHTRAEQLQEVAASLEDLSRRRGALRAAGVAANGEALFSRFASRAAELETAFINDRSSIIPPLDPSFLNPLKTLITQQKGVLENAWRQHVEQIVGQLPEDLLRALDGTSSLRTIVGEIRALHRQAETIASTLPIDVDASTTAVGEACRIRDEKAEKLEQLRGIPPEVVEFMRRVTLRRATLNDVTPVVRDWLRDQNLLEKLGVNWTSM